VLGGECPKVRYIREPALSVARTEETSYRQNEKCIEDIAKCCNDVGGVSDPAERRDQIVLVDSDRLIWRCYAEGPQVVPAATKSCAIIDWRHLVWVLNGHIVVQCSRIVFSQNSGGWVAGHS